MSEFHFVYPSMLVLLSAVPVVGWLLYWGYWRKERLLRRLVSPEMLKRLRPGLNWPLRLIKIGLVCLALLLLLLALARPRWGFYLDKMPQQGRDLVVLLDLSNSMLAEDTKPSRLERAKLDLNDLVASLAGDRVALVVFAGQAQVRCPLTHDYAFFRWTLDGCYPGIVPLGGTCIGDAIRKAVAMLVSKEEQTAVAVADSWWQKIGIWLWGATAPEAGLSHVLRHKAIMLVTDGEDHDSAPLEAARLARHHQIKIFTVGLGNQQEGAQIPLAAAKNSSRAYQTDQQGQVVWSRLQEPLLQELALTSGGAYLPIRTRKADLAEFFHNQIAQLPAQEYEASQKKRPYERFQIFLFGGLVLLLVEAWLEEGRRRKIMPGKSTETIQKTTVLILLSVSSVSLAGGCFNDDPQAPAKLAQEGNRLLAAGKFADARIQYGEALKRLPQHPYLLYNQGNAWYGERDWEKSLMAYQSSRQETAALANPQEHLYRLYFNMGCIAYRQALDQMQTSTGGDLPAAIQKLRDSLATFRQALEVKPDDPDTLHNIGVVKAKWKECLELLDRQQKQDRQNSQKQQDQKQQDQKQQDQKQQQGQQDQKPSAQPKAVNQQESQPKERKPGALSAQEAEQLLEMVRRRMQEHEEAKKARALMGTGADKDW